MIVLNIKCRSAEDMPKLRDRMCEALVGSPAFINNEIAVCDFTDYDKAFSIFIGKPNGNDIEYDLIDEDFMVCSDEKEEREKKMHSKEL